MPPHWQAVIHYLDCRLAIENNINFVPRMATIGCRNCLRV